MPLPLIVLMRNGMDRRVKPGDDVVLFYQGAIVAEHFSRLDVLARKSD